MRVIFLFGAFAGVGFGWVWKTCHSAFRDYRGAVGRLRRDRPAFWKQVRVSAVAACLALVLVVVLLARLTGLPAGLGSR